MPVNNLEQASIPETPPETASEPQATGQPIRISRFDRLFYRCVRSMAKLFCMVYFRIRVSGVEHIPAGGGFLVASNHQCYFDPVFLGSGLRRPLHYMTRSSAFKIPFVGWLISKVNAFPVERGQADIRAIRHALELLQQGEGLLVFPEGTRTSDGQIGKMKQGVINIAQRAGCPIVPAAVRGGYEAWPRHQKWPRPKRVRVAFGAPMSPGSAKSEAGDVAQRLEESIRALYQGLENRNT